MNKQELVEAIKAKLGADASKKQAEEALDAVLESLKDAIKSASKEVKLKGDAAEAPAVQLIGFGTFSVTRRNAREGINPLTKEKIKIKASKAVKFKAGAALKELVS